MKTSSKIPLLFTAKKFLYKLEGEKLTALIENPRPVLLACEGIYTYININKIKNFIRRVADEKLRAKNNEIPYTPCIVFKWNRNVTDVYLAEAIKELLEVK